MTRALVGLFGLVLGLILWTPTARAEEGYWERLPQHLPNGAHSRHTLGGTAREHAIRGEELQGVNSWRAYSGEINTWRWTTTWSLPPERLPAGAVFRINLRTVAQRVQGSVETSFTHAAWLVGEGLGKDNTEVKTRMETARQRRADATLTLRAPGGPGRTGRFDLVINGAWRGWAGVDLPAVYPYRWVVADPKAEIRVRAVLEDGDDQLTPADQATIRLEIQNVDNRTDADGLRVEVWFVPDAETLGGTEGKLPSRLDHLRVGPALRFDRPDVGRRIRRDGVDVPAGTRSRLRLPIHVEDEDNYYVYQVLMQGGGKGRLDIRRKPVEEPGFALAGALAVQIRQGEDVLFDGTIDIVRGERTARVQYPDLRSLAGTPPEDLPYYRYGDPGRSPSGHAAVRAIAVRAARYGAPGGLMPEGDALQVLDNTTRYVHEAYMPKYWPETIGRADVVATELYNYDYGPGNPRNPRSPGDKQGFPCIEHAFTLNTLTRALGFPTREVNALTWLHVGPFASMFQDASSQIWCEGRWHYRSIFGPRICTTPHERYGGFNRTFEMWIGVGRYTGEDTRFEMTAGSMLASSAWKFWGYGNIGGFVERDERPSGGWSLLGTLPSYLYQFHSPVAASVRRADGTTFGATRRVEPSPEVIRYLMQGGPAPAGFPTARDGSHWYPEGLPVHRETPSGRLELARMPQTLVVPADGSSDKTAHEIVLRATGAGPWRMEVHYVDEHGIQKLGERSGEVAPGDVVTIKTRELGEDGPRRSWEEARPGPEPSPAAAMIGWSTQKVDALTAAAFGLPEGAVVVHTIVQGGGADAAGVEWLDLVDAVDGNPVREPGDIGVHTAGKKPGDRVTIALRRGKERARKTIEIQLVPRDFRLARGAGVQGYSYVDSPEAFGKEVMRDRKHGDQITSIAHDGKGWLMVRTRAWGMGLQVYGFPRTLEEVRRRMDAGQREGYAVTHLAWSGDRFALIRSKGLGWTDQRLLAAPTPGELVAQIQQGWKDDLEVTAVTRTEAQWCAVMSAGAGLRRQTTLDYGSYEGFRSAIRRMWNAGKALHHVVSDGERWFAVASEAPVALDQFFYVIGSDKDVATEIREAWDDDWRINFVTNITGTWAFGFVR